jgi:antitoxin (DNA-binding transcriptional repressor) of toxin-antitoxin stability system
MPGLGKRIFKSRPLTPSQKPSLDAITIVIHYCLTMKSATIRDLRNEFSRVARWIEEGECVEITRSGKPFAQLAPISVPATSRVEMPDFLARIRENFPNEKLGKGLSSVVDYDRGDR